MDECLCCHLFKFETPVSHTDKRPHVCEECQAHYRDPHRRDADHITAWSLHHRNSMRIMKEKNYESRTRAEAAEAEAKELRVSLADAIRLLQADTSDHFDAFGPELRKRLQSDAVTTSEQRARSAYRQRDYSMNALSAIADHHYGTAEAKCRCGSRNCTILEILSHEIEQIEAWEAAQRQRMRDGLEHGLRRDHPDAIKGGSQNQFTLWHGLPARGRDQTQGTRRR
ncbi:hypothetical protein [Microbacterium sp. PA5]|uniref:hypothetical protein n=1 Tax=Microbacterium sp. PA5 TaxID=3416654 RepID=UPI003CEA6FEA